MARYTREIAHPFPQQSDTMATQMNLLDIFSKDPDFGSVDRYLTSGGSWFEADQMYWQIIQQQALKGLREVTAAKPTKSNQERAEELLNNLKSTTSQLFPTEQSLSVFQQADALVKTWAPPPKTASAKKGKRNTFAVLDEVSEEE
jgi:hypothetical protein